nr:hypothetical protein [Candidatus Sigynarchaeota archaeon]
MPIENLLNYAIVPPYIDLKHMDEGLKNDILENARSMWEFYFLQGHSIYFPVITLFAPGNAYYKMMTFLHHVSCKDGHVANYPCDDIWKRIRKYINIPDWHLDDEYKELLQKYRNDEETCAYRYEFLLMFLKALRERRQHTHPHVIIDLNVYRVPEMEEMDEHTKAIRVLEYILEHCFDLDPIIEGPEGI